MVDAGQLGILLVAGLASLFMAWTVGAGWTPFAPAVGARTSTVMRGAFITGTFALAGAILQGSSVTEAMAADLIGGVALSSVAAVVALIIAAALVAIGIFTGYPLATAFTATGAIVGVGLAVGPLVPMLDSLALPILVVLVFGGIGMTLGQWMGGPRMIKALAQVAVIYGVSVSFNAIIVSAVVGSGFAAGAARISKQKMLYTVGGWVVSLVLSLVLAYGAIVVINGL